MNFKFLFVCIIVGLAGLPAVAQSDTVATDTTEFDIFGDVDDGFSLIEQKPLTIDMEHELELSNEAKEARKAKEKRRKRNVFYGLKTKKGFTRKGYGEKVEVEVFHYLKDFKNTDPYVPEIYWYDKTRRRIRHTGDIEDGRGVVLHGPYKRMVGEQVVEEGIFYKGVKNGRWTTYDRNNILLSKLKYYHGWPKESKVKYWDDKQTKLKEVVPIVYGKLQGTYYYFHENGTVGIIGKYEDGVKVGKWTEYYPFRRRRKKEIQYPSDPYDKSYAPFISREWDRSNKLVYEARF